MPTSQVNLERSIDANYSVARTDSGGAMTVVMGFADSLSAPEVVWSLVDAGFEVVAFARTHTRPALCWSRYVNVQYVTDPTQ